MEPPEVTADHPGVQQAVAAAEQKARETPPELTQEMYMVALKTGVEEAEKKRRREPQGPRFDFNTQPYILDVDIHTCISV